MNMVFWTVKRLACRRRVIMETVAKDIDVVNMSITDYKQCIS